MSENITENDQVETPVVVEDATPEQVEPDTFPRDYVEKLRKEAADNRAKAKRADDLAERLFRAQVAATGRLADAGDLPFDAALLDDESALQAAVDELLRTHPHYGRRVPRGDVGQGVGAPTPGVSLIDMLRGA